jgi:hypothetical protein
MEPLLGSRPNVCPPLVINQNTNFPISEAESISSQQAGTTRDETTSNNDEAPPPDGDPFIPRSAHRSKKKRRVREPNKLMNTLMDTLQDKWRDNAELEAARNDVQDQRADRMLDIMAKSEENMSKAVDVLRLIAEKL